MPNVSHEVLPIVVQENNALIEAKLLHQKLQVSTRLGDWIQRRINEYGFEKDKDYYSNLSSKTGKGGHNALNYLLTLDMAKELAMLERNDIGRSIRRYFIAKEKELRGISYLPPATDLLKGLRPVVINDRELYPYKTIRERCGYATKTSTHHYRSRYISHFVVQGDLLYCTREMATHLHHQRQVTLNRKALREMQPVLPFTKGGAA